jgi:uncharacterized protein (DUF305 family)
VVVVAGAALAAGVVLAGGGGDGEGGSSSDRARTVQPGAPGEQPDVLTDEEAADVDAPEATAADTTFMQDMVVHHRQALDMAALVEDRTDREDLHVLAERITLSQEAEIELLTGWLTDRGEDVPAEGEDHEHHGSMPGMATADQLDALEAARDADFDRTFLELMIAHNQGAVTMVQDLYEAGGGLETEADRVARSIDSDQTIEIGRMQDLLDALP